MRKIKNFEKYLKFCNLSSRSVGLDNLGDTSSRPDRLVELSIGDEDGTGSIDFEEFLAVCMVILLR